MFFCAFMGVRSQADAWRQAVRRHAAWLGLVVIGDRIDLAADERIVDVAWLTSVATAAPAAPRLLDAPPSVVLATQAGRVWHAAAGQPRPVPLPADDAGWRRWLAEPKSNVPLVRIDRATGAVEAFAPLTGAEQLCYAADGRGLVLATDQRLLIRWCGLDLDPDAAHGLLLFGKWPAPVTLSRHIRRLAPGCLLVTQPSLGQRPVQTSLAGIIAEPDAATACQDQSIADALDQVLAAVPRSALLYFSGGVDSALLALRLKAIGRTDVPLVHFCFAADEPRADVAREIARRLGLGYERVVYDPADLATMLARLGTDYTFPVSGRSVVPTNMLVHAGQQRIGRVDVALEGTGADALFGIDVRRRQWQKVYRLPRLVRRAAGWLGGATGQWLGDAVPGSASFYAGVLGRASRIPSPEVVLLMQNALDGVAYRVPFAGIRALSDGFEAMLQPFTRTMAAADRFALLDVMCICAGEFAAKSYDPLSRMGTQAVFPYLEPPLLRAAWSLPWAAKCPPGAAKAPLKRLLAAQLPKELVYLPKEGFIPPFRGMLQTEPMQDLLRGVVLAPANPLLAYCRPKVIVRLTDMAAHGRLGNHGTQRFLWSLMVASAWLQQIGTVRADISTLGGYPTEAAVAPAAATAAMRPVG